MSDRRSETSEWARFGGFELNLRTGELTRQGGRIRLTDKPFEVLVSLLERSGELVTREELQQRLWGDDTFVDFDNNLNATVSRLREALNDSAQGPRFIETIPRKGYRYVGPPPAWGGAPEGHEGVDPVPPAERGGRRAGLGLSIGLLAVAAVVLVLAMRWGGGETRGPESEESPPPAARLMLAVLPFENLSEDPHQEYLADGLTEELLTRLGGIAPERLGVIARTSVRRYKGTEKTIGEIGDELGVDYVVEGSVRVQGERVRVNAQLIRVSDQTHVWAEAYEHGTEDLLAIQNDIAVQVSAAVLPRVLLPEESRPAGGGTLDPEAFDEFLQGLFDLAQDDIEPSRRAIEHFEAALEADPGFARAWVGLAEARNLVFFGAETDEERQRLSSEAREAVSRALELDPSLVEAYVALAFAELYHDFDPAGASAALERPLEAAPNSAFALQLAAAAFAAQARHEEALAAAAEGLVLDPRSSRAGALLGWYQLFAGKPAAAGATCQEVLERDPESRYASECLYQAQLEGGKGSEAVRTLGTRLIAEGVEQERFATVDPDDPAVAIPEVERIRLEHIFSRRSEDPSAAFDAATAFARLGEVDRAFSALEMALEARDARLLYLAVDPRFEALASDARLEELRRRLTSP